MVALALMGAAGCDCRPRRAARVERRVPLPLQILADRGTAALPRGAPDTARAWLGRVSTSPPPPARVAPSPPGSLLPPAPAIRLDSLAVVREPEPAAAGDDELKPPIPLGATPLRLPGGGRLLRLEIDVRIDEQGQVSDALWAGGSQDSAAVAAAVDCALRMRFFPALRRGHPVAVWCRQTFEFGRGLARPAAEGGAGPPENR
jgi:hypothetical protein